MPPRITLGVYRRLDNRFEGLSDDSPQAWELHNRRKDALHEVFDGERGVEVFDWGCTDDNTRTHEYVELAIGAVGVAALQYAVVPGLQFLGEKLAEKAVDTATGELVKAVVSWLRPKQESKKVLDFVITLPDGSQVMIDPPDRYATIRIQFAGGQVESLTYVQSPHGESQVGGANMITILFLSADPTDAARLRLGEELREIQEKLQLARLRERFRLEQRMSIRPADISQALLDVRPQIVHFSGHGTATGALCFENLTGETHPIETGALTALFEQFANQVNCVILNACYSEIQANAISQHINYVIGMNQAVGDKAAIAFAIGFYQALGGDRTIEDAYKLGCVQIRLQGIPEHLTPVLIKKR